MPRYVPIYTLHIILMERYLYTVIYPIYGMYTYTFISKHIQ